MESALERQSYRINLVEQKRLDKHLKLLTNSQKTVAMEIQKSQREMKRRLQRYRDRQRDLIGEEISGPALTVEDILKKHQPRLASQTSVGLLTRNNRRSRMRPATAPAPKMDMSLFLDLQKSKVDLRPMTASSRRQEILRDLDFRASSAARGYRPVTGERLGSPDMEARYFVDEELDERSSFYYDLVEWRKRNESKCFKDVNKRVMNFCGLKPKEGFSIAKTKWKSVGLALRFQKLASEAKNQSARAPTPPNLSRFRRKGTVRSPTQSPDGPEEAWVTADGGMAGNGPAPSRKISRELSPTSPTRPISSFL